MWPTAAVSSDRLAFERLLTNGDVYRFEVGCPPKVVAASSFADYNPNFSPDGRRFAFESGRGGEGDEIWLAASDGSNPTRLTHGPGIWQGSPRWSPDGTRIAFDSQDKDGRWGIWTVDVDGGSPRRLSSAPDSNLPSWSRDGKVVYFSSNRTGTYNVWRVPASGGPEERVTHTGGWLAYESTDGKTLFFFQREGSQSPLFAVPVAGGQERKVIDCVSGWGFAVGGAGVYHVGCKANQRAVSLYLLDPATGRDRLLGKLEGYDGNGLTASPDGKTILYSKLVGEGSDLMMIENFR
jgi:Tol biopolymer transport system component